MNRVWSLAVVALLTAVVAVPMGLSAPEPTVRNPIDELTQCIGEMTQVTTDEGWVTIDHPTGFQTGLALARTNTRTDAAYYEYVTHLGSEDAPTSVTYLVTGYTSQVACSATCLCPSGWTVNDYVEWIQRTISGVVEVDVAIADLVAQASCNLP